MSNPKQPPSSNLADTNCRRALRDPAFAAGCVVGTISGDGGETGVHYRRLSVYSAIESQLIALASGLGLAGVTTNLLARPRRKMFELAINGNARLVALRVA